MYTQELAVSFEILRDDSVPSNDLLDRRQQSVRKVTSLCIEM